METLCEPPYASADKQGRRSLPPSVFFRRMLVNYFEGIHSERGICWRCTDSISLRDFLGLGNYIAVPDQTAVSRTRRRLPVDGFDEVFCLVLGIVAERGLLKGPLRGVDSNFLQADASMKHTFPTPYRKARAKRTAPPVSPL
ncbi:MAG: transposase, partial [Myxococcota bacterium]